MTGAGDTDSHDVAERIARTSYGKLVAILAARLRDVSAAEDALGAAFEKALALWPRDGVPANPEGWLIRVARNQGLDRLRHEAVRDKIAPALTLLAEDSGEDKDMLFADDRLRLMFTCAHPAIDPAMHTPLMLQTVLGLDAARIGSAFLVAPATMGQRLVRAKTKIKAAGIPFDMPDRDKLPDRLEAVLAAIYAAYGTGWDNAHGADEGLAGLTGEALFLGDLVCALLPGEPEARGLQALMLYTAAREEARRAPEGSYVPLNRQDTKLWDRAMIARAETLLGQAAEARKPGRYQTEAAIQSAHIRGRLSGRISWSAILTLYTALLMHAPSLGAHVSHASALARTGRATDALQRLDDIRDEAERYQPYWAVRAYCHRQLDEVSEAAKAYDLAIGLSEDKAVQDFLMAEKATLNKPG